MPAVILLLEPIVVIVLLPLPTVIVEPLPFNPTVLLPFPRLTPFFDGVEKSFAIQAGRELRVIVKPDEIDDLAAYQVARDIKDKIEQTMQYPGTIKVTVIRETRAIEEAK